MNGTLNDAQPRKQLSDQLDRLDSILDGLSDAIPQVIADAVQHATKTAVQAAVAEILANPQLLQALQAQQPTTLAATLSTPSSTNTTPPSNQPSLWSRASKGVWNSAAWVGKQIGRVGGFVARSISSMARASVACARYGSYPVVSAVLAVIELVCGVRRAFTAAATI